MINRVEIQVIDLPKQREFWGWLLVNALGWTVFQDWPEGRSWCAKRGNSYIVLKSGPALVAPEHIAIEAPSAGAVQCIWAQLADHGGRPLYEGQHPHADGSERYAAYFADPAGIKLEVVWEPKRVVVNRLKNLPDELLVNRWCQHLDHVRVELRWLSRQRRAMEKVTDDVINANPRVLGHSGRIFLDMMRSWYASAMALAYRRQDDADQGSASLRVVLEELLARPEAYRIETIKPVVGPLADDADIRAEVMAPVIGTDGKLNQELVRRDLLELRAVGKRVRDFVNHFVAHTDADANQQPTAEVVTFTEIYEAHRACERIAERWLKAFRVYTYSLDPDEKSDWLDLFDFPWRLRKPDDEPEAKKYLVTLHPCLSGAETEAWFDGIGARTPEERERARHKQIQGAIEEFDKLTPANRYDTLPVLPYIVSVERLV